MNITITDKAASFIRRMIRFNGGTANAGFRLVVSPGGCSGFNSSFTVEATPLQGDAVLDNNGVKVFLPAESRIMLQGVTVDFADTAMSTGLSFINPNAQSCGCSSSEIGAPPKTATVSIASIQRRQ
ncbi:MAG TPA: iron-sulfur cluster assembly accessory protein [Gallionellaceae bacterium]|nr:iron-sulfur cluster assembly accessory protein [Gallionellaceae bacterium]